MPSEIKLHESYGRRSAEELRTCHIDWIIIFNKVAENYECSIIKGHRGEAEQTEAVRTGASRTPWPRSQHNKKPSMAIDAAPWYKERPHIRWEDLRGFAHFWGYVQGVADQLFDDGKISHKVRWGGDWDGDRDQHDQLLNDLVHGELVKP